jgi:type IV pilus assembly protein PilY1
VVQDVFADFTGTGVREWHTVLVVSVGSTGRDLFALDVTHPLKPVLLWHLTGSIAQAGGYPPYSAVSLTEDGTGGTGFSAKWSEPDALFVERPAADPGRLDSGLYDYSDLGGASGLAIGQMRRGLDPVYAVFAATNASGVNGVSRGLEVFAIDVATGQKLWQWEQPYAASWADNTVPPVVSVLPGQDGASRLLVGDMEGRLWELDAGSGMNANVVRGAPGCAVSSPCKLAALDTRSTSSEPQPLTTNIAVARLPTTPSGALAPYGSALVALVGTAGADWVGASVPGRVHVLLLEDRYRKPVRAGGSHLDGTAWAQAPALNSAQQDGLLQEPSPFPLQFAAGAHLRGAITVAGRTAFFQTASGPANDPMTLDGRTVGATYSMNLGNVTSTLATQLGTTTYANFGGVSVLHRATGTGSQDFIVGQEVSRITNTVITNTATLGDTSPDPDLSLQGNPGMLYRLLNWVQRRLL